MKGPNIVHSDWNARIWIEGVGDAERRLEVTPAIVGWDHLSVRSYTFRAGQTIDGESATDEMAMVLLSGTVTIEIDGPTGRQTWECHGRSTVFDGAPYAIYLPPNHTYRTTVHQDADCVYGRAPAEGRRRPRLIRPDDTAELTDTFGNRVRLILEPGMTEHLLCQETLVELGTWAFDQRHGADLELVTYYRTDPIDGWALQRLVDAGGHDTALTVRHGDAVIIRGGQAPLVAAPQTRLYALTYLADPAPIGAE